MVIDPHCTSPSHPNIRCISSYTLNSRRHFFMTRILDCYGYEAPSHSPSSTPPFSLNTLFATGHPRILLLITCPVRTGKHGGLTSSSSLFATMNWLEREAAEMHGLDFIDKWDSRNLMLPYGDASAPLQKCLPSIGTREIFYDSLTDQVISRPVSIQF